MTNQSPKGPVVIAGGSGFLGTSLADYLHARGWSVVTLSRHPPQNQFPWRHLSWDARTIGDWCVGLEGASALINLAGRSVDCIKTTANKDEILRSRIESTRVLGIALRTVNSPPPVWIQMSSAHIYGDPAEAVCSEDSAFGCGFAPFVAQRWEAEFQASLLPDQRPVALRTSFVIGHERGVGNGALAKLAPLARWGLGGTIGSGSQGVSWIHETDINRLFERSILDHTMRGAYVASSPNPVSSRKFMSELRHAVRAPFGFPASSLMVRMGAKWFLQTDPELALCGRYVTSRRLEAEGFEFRYPEISEALEDLFQKSN